MEKGISDCSTLTKLSVVGCSWNNLPRQYSSASMRAAMALESSLTEVEWSGCSFDGKSNIYPFHMRTETGRTWVQPGFHSHAPLNNLGLTRPQITCLLNVIRGGIVGDLVRLSLAMANAHVTSQSSQIKGSSKEKVRNTVSCEAKAEADSFLGSHFELFCKGHYTTLRTIWVKEAYERTISHLFGVGFSTACDTV